MPGPLPLAALSALAFAAAIALAVRRPGLLVGRPRAVLGVLGAVSVVAALALVRVQPPGLRLSLDPSTEPLLPADDPGRAVYRDAVLDFGDDEIYVIAVECDEVFSLACLTGIRRVSDRIAHVDGVRSVQSLVDVTSFRWVPAEDWIEVRPFIEEIPSDPARLADLRERALADPVYRQTLVSPDSRAAAIDVRFRDMSDAEFIARDVDGQIERLLREESRDGLRFHVAGRPHAKSVVYHGIVSDLQRLIPLALGVIAAVLLLSGSWHVLLLSMGTALAGCLWTFAAMAVVGRPLTILTGLLAPTLLAIGSVYGVHVVARYEEDLEACRDSRRAAERALRHVAVPVMLSGLTTVVGFGALCLSDVPAVFELGCFSMFGIAALTVLALTGVPAALALRRSQLAVGQGDRVLARGAAAVNRLLERLLGALARASTRHAGLVIAACAAAVAVAALAIPRIEIDTDYLSYFSPDAPVRRDFEAVNRLLAGAVPLYVVIDGSAPGAFREPRLLRSVEDLQQRLDATAGVSRTLSFLDTLRVLNRAFHAGDPAQERIPDTRPGVAQLLFMIPKAEAQRFVTVNHLRGNVVVRTGEVGSAAIEALAGRIQALLDDGILPPGTHARVTGNALLLARSADGIARSQPRTVGLAALAIFVLIAVGLRSPRLGAVAMVPNIVPVVWFFGLLGAGLAPLSLPTSLIGSVALGIAIDDTTHYLVRYLAERRGGSTPEQAALACGRSVGRPIVITSVMLFFGFLVMWDSAFATLQQFGTLIGTTMVLCLAADLVLLPALLVRLRV